MLKPLLNFVFKPEKLWGKKKRSQRIKSSSASNKILNFFFLQQGCVSDALVKHEILPSGFELHPLYRCLNLQSKARSNFSTDLEVNFQGINQAPWHYYKSDLTYICFIYQVEIPSSQLVVKLESDTGEKPGKGPDSKLTSFRDLLLIDPSIICRFLTINPYQK